MGRMMEALFVARMLANLLLVAARLKADLRSNCLKISTKTSAGMRSRSTETDKAGGLSDVKPEDVTAASGRENDANRPIPLHRSVGQNKAEVQDGFRAAFFPAVPCLLCLAMDQIILTARDRMNESLQ